jgi:DNA-binding transcriptional ArsR family regulator
MKTTVVKILFGSHLYGTSTPDSDRDFKGVFLPSRRDIILGNIPKSINHSTGDHFSKNGADDVDTELFSLHHFMKLAIEGQTVAFDMLHAPSEFILSGSPVWDSIVANRELFYTKNLKSFIGYARRQASKYGIRGSRLHAAKAVVKVLDGYSPETRLAKLWADLPAGEHLHNLPDAGLVKQYQVCGRTLQSTITVFYATGILNKFIEGYGARAKLAEQNKGIDWKAVSHALRAAYQVREILIDNTITFPLKDCEYLTAVKCGKVDYLTDAAPTLENLMDEVEDLSVKSTLPDKVNAEFWENFLVGVVTNEVL